MRINIEIERIVETSNFTGKKYALKSIINATEKYVKITTAVTLLLKFSQSSQSIIYFL